MYVYVFPIFVVTFHSQHKLSKYLLSDEHYCLDSPTRGVVPGVTRTVQMTTILSVTPRRYVYVYIHIIVLWYGNSGPLPNTIIIGFCIPTRGPPHNVPLLLTLRARWGSRVYQFSGNTFARMTHWEIGKHPTSIIKTRVHYTYLIPRRGRYTILESTVS